LNSADESRVKHGSERAMIVDVEDESPHKVENSINRASSSQEGTNEGYSKGEASGEQSSERKASDASEKSGGNTVSTETCSGKGNEMVELTQWLHDSQCPLSDQQLEELHVELDDFKQALKSVQPSAKREGFATVPDVTWEDVGSLRNIREELQMSILVSYKTDGWGSYFLYGNNLCKCRFMLHSVSISIVPYTNYPAAVEFQYKLQDIAVLVTRFSV
jgi:ribosome biogenesis ATPase